MATSWAVRATSRGFPWGARAECMGGSRASTAGTGSAGTTHRSLSGHCSVSVTAALGQLRGSLPGSVAAPRAGLTRPSSQSAASCAQGLVQTAVLRVCWGSGSSLCPRTSGGCLVQEAETAARAGGGRKEKLALNCIHEGAPTNLEHHKLSGKCSATPHRHQLTTVTMYTSQNISHPSRARLNSLPSQTLAGKRGHLCHPGPLCTHGDDSGRGASVQALAPGDCSLPEEAHVPDGLILQLRPKQGVGLGQDRDEPDRKAHV